MSEPNYKTILFQLIGSLTLCDHMGDVSNDVDKAMELAGVEIEWSEWEELGDALGRMGITTLYGTELHHEDDPPTHEAR